MPYDMPLITTIAGAFLCAWVLGSLAQRLGISPIVGYLLAGVVVGPHTPGFVADAALAAQLAEIGVVLLMFGVGLQFHLKDLLAMKGVAVPGAVIHTACATLVGVAAALAFGWTPAAALVVGLALSIASTVVLVRALEESQLLQTVPGQIAVGWLIVEDVLAVIALVMIPLLAGAAGDGHAAAGSQGAVLAAGRALGKLAALVALVLLAGSRVVPWLMERSARLRSRELFTLTVLAIAMAIAAGSAHLFGTSIALGAFLAGMVVGQSPVSHQAAADALPLRDAFGVLFFVSVGMLFDPAFLLREPALVLALLAVVLVAKPLVAIVVAAALGYSVRSALVVTIGMGQIGEFSFILGELARSHGLLPDAAPNALVACAVVSISVNPLLFRLLDPLEAWLQRHPRLWRALNARAERRHAVLHAASTPPPARAEHPLAIIVGYGPVGQSVDRALRESGLETLVVDLNIDTVSALAREQRPALFGDASHPGVLKRAGIERAGYLLVTLPHSVNRGPLIAAARNLNPDCRILVRARYLRERADLEQAGATAAVFEETEAAVALTQRLLEDLGTDAAAIERELDRIRREFGAARG